MGVAYADEQLRVEEKKYFQRVISQFVSPDSSLGQTIRLMIKGVCRNKIYSQLQSIKCLVQALSESERLIILCFGCRLSAADGCVQSSEKRYLCQVAEAMSMPAQYIATLFFLADGDYTKADPFIVSELKQLIDPQRFQSIDPAIVKAASFIRSKFFENVQPSAVNLQKMANRKLSYEKLEKFQGYQNRLGDICTELEKVVQSEGDYDLFPTVLSEEVRKLSESVRSQRFRIAVVGEFSQGKSTFLNALLGEELQPVRAIPCSGTLTTLKYGPKRRAVCHYKDGTQQVIPFEQYQQQASIPEEAALGNRTVGLAESDIAEIVLEHPGLELCKHHVEIVDSPGLNEHPERTAVTEKLLEETDAVIFLANAQRPLTQGERELLQSIKARLSRNKPDAPAENLFVLVNFMDLLRSPRDKEQIQVLFKNFLLKDTDSLVKDSSRIHFISAQSALDATLTRQNNEYLNAFRRFVKDLEIFLAEERGVLSLRKHVSRVRSSISSIQNGFLQTTQLVKGEINVSENECQNILNKIGEVSGIDVRIRDLSYALFDKSLGDIEESWKEWLENIDEKLLAKTADWKTQHEDKAWILKDYAEQFVQDISRELDEWLQEGVAQTILRPRTEQLSNEIEKSLSTIQYDLETIDRNAGSELSRQFELSEMGIGLGFSSKLDANAVDDPTSSFGKLGLKGSGGIVAAGALAFAGFSLFPVLIAGGVAGTVTNWLFGKDLEDVKMDLKIQVHEKGAERFSEASDEIIEQLVNRLESIFEQKYALFHKAVDSSLSILCCLLEQQKGISRESIDRKNAVLKKIEQRQIDIVDIEDNVRLLQTEALA